MITFRRGRGAGQTGQWLCWVHVCVLVPKQVDYLFCRGCFGIKGSCFKVTQAQK